MYGMHPGMRGGGLHRFTPNLQEKEPLKRIEFRQLIRLLTYVRPYIWVVVFSLIVSIASIFLHLIPPRLMGIIIDQAIGKMELSILYKMAILLFVVSASANFLGGLKTFLMGRLGQKVVFTLWQDVYATLQQLSFSFYDNAQTGDIMSRITGDVGAVERLVINGMDEAIASLLTLVGIAFILFWMNFRLALIAIIPIPILAVFIWFFTRLAHSIYSRVRRKMGEVNALLQDSISGIREVKSFGREDYEMDRFSEKGYDYVSTNLQAIKLWSTFFPLMATITSLGSFLVLWFGGKMAITSASLTTGELVAFLFYLAMFYQPIRQLNMVNHMLQHARAACERIFEVIDAVPKVKEAANAIGLPQPVKGGVIFHNVRFSYPLGESTSEKTEEVLHGIDIEVRRGEIVALVGPTGAGKSTIVKLIPRFYDVTDGAVLVDGIDVRKLKLKDLRGNIGIVMQEPFLFNGTVRENIAYGKIDATADEVIRMAKMANAHQFIMELALGYESEVGERGVKLSVGEKQRIAIARALLKDPPILILDEATSSVDNRTEALIQQAIERLLRQRTCFVIAHRLSTVINASKILVVEDGRIVEMGTHAQLLAKDGLYRNLYHSQWRTTADK